MQRFTFQLIAVSNHPTHPKRKPALPCVLTDNQTQTYNEQTTKLRIKSREEKTATGNRIHRSSLSRTRCPRFDFPLFCVASPPSLRRRESRRKWKLRLVCEGFAFLLSSLLLFPLPPLLFPLPRLVSCHFLTVSLSFSFPLSPRAPVLAALAGRGRRGVAALLFLV